MFANNINLDTIKFMKKTMSELRSDINYAYPNEYYDTGRGHTALQMVKSKIEVIDAFLSALNETDRKSGNLG
jgi:hypothetical protein